MMEKYVDTADQGVRFMPAAEVARTSWNLPRSNEPGYMRAIGRGFRGRSASLGVGIMLVGQRSPLHSADAEHLLLGIEGSITWNVDGTPYSMGPMDLLFVGAGIVYEYWNSGFSTARFVDVIGKVDSWPPQGNYAPPVSS
jgi:quercetin dioxygenase-like cupin family protein